MLFHSYALRDCWSVPGLMIDDLKEQEGVHRVRCFRTGGDKPNPRAVIRFGEFVANLFLDSRHRRCARRIRVVNEHRRVEIPGGKHLGDVSEVSSNLVDAHFIFRVVGADVDFSSVVEQSEMMCGRFVRKPHDMFTTRDDSFRTLILVR